MFLRCGQAYFFVSHALEPKSSWSRCSAKSAYFLILSVAPGQLTHFSLAKTCASANACTTHRKGLLMHNRSYRTVLVGIVLAYCWSGRAGIIDLSQIPDGTLASAGNPYDGVLTIGGSASATESSQSGVSTTDFQTGGPTVVHGWYPHGAFLEAYTGPLLASPQAWSFSSSVNVGFLKPVSDVSFDWFTWWYGKYSYSAVNSLGNVITGGAQGGFRDTTMPSAYESVNIDLPAGYHFTSLDVSEGDNLGSDCQIWVADIGYKVANGGSAPVPDRGSSVSLLAIGICGLIALKPLLRKADSGRPLA
jgi:hypothetical protein